MDQIAELITLVDERLLKTLQVAEFLVQQSAVVAQQVCYRSGGVADIRGAGGQRIGMVLQPGDQSLEIVDGLVELLPVLDRDVQHGVEVLDHLADRLVTLGDLGRSAPAVWSRMSLMVPP